MLDDTGTVADGRKAQEGPLRIRDIDPDALKVVRKLLSGGHEAFLVGGCVRDLYLHRRPKDFDVATSARPEQIRRIFRNSRVIGRRFKLVHVYYGSKVIEVSTFRAKPPEAVEGAEAEGEPQADLMITRDNEWGTIEDDARRRDFTINALFYDLDSKSIVDFVDGLTDLERGVIRTIGVPEVRFREDPVRMIRAVKFAARLDFSIEEACWKATVDTAPDIAKCSRARLLEELYKLLRSGSSRRSFELLLEAGLFEHIWPRFLGMFEDDDGVGLQRRPLRQTKLDVSTLLWRYLDALDTYVLETRQIPTNGVIVATLFASLLDEALRDASRAELDMVIDDVMTPACTQLGVARRDRELARQIFMAHRRMLQPSKRGGPSKLVQRQYFHDALVFLGFSVAARMGGETELERWRQLASIKATSQDEGEPRRKSGGRRRRRKKKNRNAKPDRDPRPAAVTE